MNCSTAIGDYTFIILEKDGNSFTDMEARILLTSTLDYRTGRRNLKGLSEVVVGRIG